MNENKRTIGYVVAAALAVVVAWEPWRPKPAAPDTAVIGQTLFTGFDPLSAKSLQVIKYDEETSALKDFQVKQKNGVWSIPSHQDYPADAAQHMAEAATSLLNLKILGMASDRPGEHELYGVVNPDIQSLKPGMVGVGTRVVIKDGKDEPLVDLIVGKADKDQPNLRYVRRPNQDYVLRAIVKIDALTTRFGDWIEKDLLKLNTLDVNEIQINDYSSQAGLTEENTLGISRLRRSRMKLGYDDAKSAWDLTELTQFERDKPRVVKLKPDEELNSDKLNAMKSALDDLKIVDVERKPPGLSGDLRVTPDFVKDESGVGSLFRRGFIPAKNEDGRLEILSTEGEVITRLKDGVEYVLRFGQIAGKGDKADKADKDKDKSVGESSGLNRYLFIMAQLNENLIPKPVLEPLPPAEEEKAPVKKPEDKKDNSANKAAAGAKAADTKAAAEPELDEAAKKAKAKKDKELQDKRDAVEKENKRKEDEYQDKLKKARDHVKELNDRFADWYYIISDQEYRKIHLGQSDVIKKKGATAEQSPGLGAFASMNNLKQISLAMLAYKDAQKKYPSAAITGKGGKPLLSWRVRLLPYLGNDGGEKLYKQFHLNEPWDSAHNRKLIAQMPSVFGGPDPAGKTRFVVPTGKGTMFHAAEGLTTKQMSDGSSQTILAIEVPPERAVVWTKPDDLPLNAKKPREGLIGGFQAVFADGSVHRISDATDEETLRRLFDPADGKTVDPSAIR